MNNLQDKKNSIILVFYFQILETCNLTHVNPFLLNNFISHCPLYICDVHGYSQDWTSDILESACYPVSTELPFGLYNCSFALLFVLTTAVYGTT